MSIPHNEKAGNTIHAETELTICSLANRTATFKNTLGGRN